MEVVSYQGRTAIIHRLQGLVLKIPWPAREPHASEFKNAIAVEKELLQILGDHPGIIQYVFTSITARY
jgi:hypothetical protein